MRTNFLTEGKKYTVELYPSKDTVGTKYLSPTSDGRAHMFLHKRFFGRNQLVLVNDHFLKIDETGVITHYSSTSTMIRIEDVPRLAHYDVLSKRDLVKLLEARN